MALIGKTNEEKIWNFLFKKIKNPYGVAGLMGNLYAESALNPKNLQNTFEKKLGLSDDEYTKQVTNGTYTNFIRDGAGYGLAQWTYYTRKEKLLKYAKLHKVNIGHLEMQLNFLWKELYEDFKPIAVALRSATSVRQASDEVLLKFERPANQSIEVQIKRAEYGQKFYNTFANTQNNANNNSTAQSNSIEIKNCFGTVNTNYLQNRKIEWIVFHYTAGVTSQTGSALNLAQYYKSGNAAASSDFTVDDTTIVQYNEDISNRYTWGVGGNKYSSMSTSLGGQYYGKCTNKNCINIEVCSNKTNRKSLNATDTDWYFTDAELEQTANLIKYLMDKYKIDIDHVIMHHQVTGKLCPAHWTQNESQLQHWYDFKKKLGATTIPQSLVSAAQSTNTFKVRVTADALYIRKGPSTDYESVGYITDKGVYTIVETRDNWGRLLSGVGWISLKYCNKIS